MSALRREDVEKITKLLDVERLGCKKGATCVVYKAKGYYVWREGNQLYLQKKWPWGRKYRLAISKENRL